MFTKSHYKKVSPDDIKIGIRPVQLNIGKSDLFKSNLIYQLYLKECLISSDSRGYKLLNDLLYNVKTHLNCLNYNTGEGITGLILNTTNLSRRNIDEIVSSLKVNSVALVKDNLRYIQRSYTNPKS